MKKIFISFISICFILFVSCSAKDNESTDSLANDVDSIDIEANVVQNLPTIIDFSAVWCPPCQKFKPIFEEASKDYAGKVEFKTIDVDENVEMAKKFNISSIPAIVFIDSNGKEVNRIVGFVDRESLDNAITDYLKVKI